MASSEIHEEPAQGRTDTCINDRGPGALYGFTATPYSGDGHHPGYPDPSETYRWGDHGTEWPMDGFTAMVAVAQEHPISRPAPHNYAGDDNMEAYQIVGPYVVDSSASIDLGAFTGATGPSGHDTPINNPELTSPPAPAYAAPHANVAPRQSRL